VVTGRPDRDHEHLEEQRERRRDAGLDAEQQEAGDEDAAEDADARGREPGEPGDDRRRGEEAAVGGLGGPDGELDG
jgi:hypothetical protein